MKQAKRKMLEAIKKDIENRFSHVPTSQLRLATAGTFENPEDAQEWQLALTDAFPEYESYYIPLSCSIACHVGINAAGIGICQILRK